MRSNGFSMRPARGLREWMQIYCLYRTSFPRSERKPFSIILSMHRRGKTDVWCFRRNGRFAGFAATINGGNLILLDYLAVSRGCRNAGVGSAALAELKRAYAGRGLFVEIESTGEACDDLEQRLRRQQFYRKNGLLSMGVSAYVFGVRMDLLGWNCSVDFDRYRDFYAEHYSPMAAKNICPAEYAGSISEK